MNTVKKGLIVLLLGGLLLAAVFGSSFLEQPESQQARAAEASYVVLSWNDLGMHCYNRDFQDLAVLPPFNTLWAQVVKVGDPPEIVTEGVRVTYSFPDNTYSVGKSNFWQYDEQLFGVDLPPNVGLTGKGMAGEMDRQVDHFVAEGIPLTEFRDSDTINPYPYQLAEVIVYDESTNEELARSTVVAPVSTEMRCDDCHDDGGVEDIATGRVETNILTLHDEESADEYPAGHDTPLMDRRPVLCAECHASNALGAPGLDDIPSLSKAMHDKHEGEVDSDLEGCYQCHPGPQTQCLRDVMAVEHGMDCVDCHGGMEEVASNPDPWLNEPRCDNEACHGSAYAQDQPLYRLSSEHGGLYCAACHDSPHAIAPGREANDGIKFQDLQGFYDTLQTCTVCHLSTPQEGGPHGAAPQPVGKTYVSPNVEGKVAGISYARGDILSFENDNWQMVFDASDLGLSRTTDLHAFSFQDDGSILMVFSRTVALPGLPGKAKAWDIVRFTPDEAGDYSAGSFSWVLDGSDVGLSSSGEKIDALDQRDGHLYLSVSGRFSVKQNGQRLTAQDEDILKFVPTALGEDTSGSWELFIDGSKAYKGLSREDIVSLSLNGGSSITVSLANNFNIEGIKGGKRDILELPLGEGDAKIVWHGLDNGFKSGVDGQQYLHSQ